LGEAFGFYEEGLEPVGGSEQMVIPFRMALIVIPVGVYFFILGWLNSRPTPQILSARCDWVLLVLAITPLGLSPMLEYAGMTPQTLLPSAVLVLAVTVLLMPRGGSWVAYNLSGGQVRRLLEGVLQELGEHPDLERQTANLSSGGQLKWAFFPLLRNVSLRLTGVDEAFQERFERELLRQAGCFRAETTPMAISLMLIAAAMMVIPLTLVAPHADEMVRMLSDMLK
jgi:hypothetical protein